MNQIEPRDRDGFLAKDRPQDIVRDEPQVTDFTSAERELLAKIVDIYHREGHTTMWMLERAFMAGKSAGLGFAGELMRQEIKP